ncbi:MAG: glycosyltransferase family 9 protein [Desulfobacteraceae bacterium]|nr:glycosyltransferase family 9 protein [Desulfobacteraceae bacterium]
MLKDNIKSLRHINDKVSWRGPRILIVRLRHLGDLLLTTPVIRELRLSFPEAQIDFLALKGPGEVLKNNPYIDNLFTIEPAFWKYFDVIPDIRAIHYDVIFDLQSSPRSMCLVMALRSRYKIGWNKRRIRNFVYDQTVNGQKQDIYVPRKFANLISAAGFPKPSDYDLDLRISNQNRQKAKAILSAAKERKCGPLIALSTVSRVSGKRWPPERYAELADWLIENYNAAIVLTNGPEEIEQVTEVVQQMRHSPTVWNYGPTSPQDLGAIYEQCDLWIGNDGGPKHIAVAAGCPTLTVIRAKHVNHYLDDRSIIPQMPLAAATVQAVNLEKAISAIKACI